jgi:hypothetical protein
MCVLEQNKCKNMKHYVKALGPLVGIRQGYQVNNFSFHVQYAEKS